MCGRFNFGNILKIANAVFHNDRRRSITEVSICCQLVLIFLLHFGKVLTNIRHSYTGCSNENLTPRFAHFKMKMWNITRNRQFLIRMRIIFQLVNLHNFNPLKGWLNTVEGCCDTSFCRSYRILSVPKISL